MRRQFRVRDDGAVSDIMGTLVMIGVTVSLLAAVALSMYSTFGATSEGPAPQVTASLLAFPGSQELRVVHQGGDALPTDALTFRVEVNHVFVEVAGATFSAEAWRLGESVALHLPAPLAKGDRVEVQIRLEPRGRLAGSAFLQVPTTDAPAPPILPSDIQFSFDRSRNFTLNNETTFLTLYVRVLHPEGRKFIEAVTVDLTPVKGAAFVAFRDDGTLDDRLAGDGVFTVSFAVPAGLITPQEVQEGIIRKLLPLQVTVHPAGAATVVATATIQVVHESQPLPQAPEATFNNALFERFGANVSRATATSTKFTLLVKMDLARMTVEKNGKTLTLSDVLVSYNMGSSKSTYGERKLDRTCLASATSSSVWQNQLDLPSGNPSDPLLFFFILVYKGEREEHREYVYSSASTTYFELRPGELWRTVETTKGDLNAIKCP